MESLKDVNVRDRPVVAQERPKKLQTLLISVATYHTFPTTTMFVLRRAFISMLRRYCKSPSCSSDFDKCIFLPYAGTTTYICPLSSVVSNRQHRESLANVGTAGLQVINSGILGIESDPTDNSFSSNLIQILLWKLESENGRGYHCSRACAG